MATAARRRTGKVRLYVQWLFPWGCESEWERIAVFHGLSQWNWCVMPLRRRPRHEWNLFWVPTQAPPKSEEWFAIMQERAALHLPIYHPQDGLWDLA